MNMRHLCVAYSLCTIFYCIKYVVLVFFTLKVDSDISDIYLQLHKSFEEESRFLVSTHSTEAVIKDPLKLFLVCILNRIFTELCLLLFFTCMIIQDRDLVRPC